MWLKGEVYKQQLIEYLQAKLDRYNDELFDYSTEMLKIKSSELHACKEMVEVVCDVKLQLGDKVYIKEDEN